MSEGMTAREFRQRDLDAAKKRLSAIELGLVGDSDGRSIEHASPEEIEQLKELIARLTGELDE